MKLEGNYDQIYRTSCCQSS